MSKPWRLAFARSECLMACDQIFLSCRLPQSLQLKLLRQIEVQPRRATDFSLLRLTSTRFSLRAGAWRSRSVYRHSTTTMTPDLDRLILAMATESKRLIGKISVRRTRVKKHGLARCRQPDSIDGQVGLCRGLVNPKAVSRLVWRLFRRGRQSFSRKDKIATPHPQPRAQARIRLRQRKRIEHSKLPGFLSVARIFNNAPVLPVVPSTSREPWRANQETSREDVLVLPWGVQANAGFPTWARSPGGIRGKIDGRVEHAMQSREVEIGAHVNLCESL